MLTNIWLGCGYLKRLVFQVHKCGTGMIINVEVEMQYMEWILEKCETIGLEHAG